MRPRWRTRTSSGGDAVGWQCERRHMLVGHVQRCDSHDHAGHRCRVSRLNQFETTIVLNGGRQDGQPRRTARCAVGRLDHRHLVGAFPEVGQRERSRGRHRESPVFQGPPKVVPGHVNGWAGAGPEGHATATTTSTMTEAAPTSEAADQLDRARVDQSDEEPHGCDDHTPRRGVPPPRPGRTSARPRAGTG